jgi:hypothetical protein
MDIRVPRGRARHDVLLTKRWSAWMRREPRLGFIRCVLAVGVPALLLTSPMAAQSRTHFGLLIPVNLASISSNLLPPPGVVSGTTTRLGLGVYVERRLPGSLSLRIEASIVGRGGPLARGVEGESELRSDYAELPALLTWSRPREGWRPFVRGGPVLAFRGARAAGFKGSSETTGQFPLTEHDFALAGGLGASRSFGRFVSGVEIRGYHSVTSVTDFGVTRNRSIGLLTSLGYRM